MTPFRASIYREALDRAAEVCDFNADWELKNGDVDAAQVCREDAAAIRALPIPEEKDE